MSTVAASAVTAIGAVVAAYVAVLATRLRGELVLCQRDRKQLRQTLQLVVGALVGLMPESERLRLLARIDDALDADDG